MLPRNNQGGQLHFGICMGRTRKYLCTQVEVAEQNCCLRAGDDQNNENQKEESKHVVHLVRPAKQKDNT